MRGGAANDRELVRGVLAGEESAFEAFFHGFYPALYRFALVRLQHDAEATEEIVHVALSKAMSGLGKYRGEAALLTWLCSFCRYEISAYYKRLGRRPRHLELVEEVPEIRAALDSHLAGGDQRPDDALRRKEIGRLVRVALDHLPRHYGQALEWKYVDGLAVKEIAARLELVPKAAESVLTRARQAFRDNFMTLCGDLAGWSLPFRTAARRR